MKKALAVLMSAILMLSLAACGGGTSSTAAEKGKSEGSQAVSGSGTSETGGEPAASGEVIKVGYFGPLTGPVSTSGQYAEKGVRLKVKQINDNGGINGKQLELISYDDKSTAEAAVKACTRLIEEDKVNVILGSQLSGNVQACGDRVEKAQIPLVGTGVSPVWLEQGWTYLFRALSNSTGGTGPLYESMKELGCTKLATICYQDEGSISGYNQIMDEVKKQGGIEVTTEEVFQPNDTDWTGQFSRMVATSPNGILLLAQGEQIGPMVKQLRSMGYNGYIYGPETMSLPDIRQVAGDAANGIVFYAPHCVPDAPEEANTEMETEFLNAFVEEYGEMPASDVAYRTYDAMTIIEEGLKNAASLDGPAIRDAIKGINGLEVLAGTIDYSQSDNGEGMKGMQIFITHAGKNSLLKNFLESNPADTYKA